MPHFRDDVLTTVTTVCRQLFDRRRALVETQAHVSDKAKSDIVFLIIELDRLRTTDPFPDRATTNLGPLEELKNRLAGADEDPVKLQDALLNWVEKAVPRPAPPADTGEPEPEPLASATPATDPLNQRMLDLTFDFRRAIDQTRRRLFRDRDRFDLDDYRAARNAFTLARAVYDERLRLGQLTATNADCARVENELLPALRQTDGAGFPAAVRAGADFLAGNIFA